MVERTSSSDQEQQRGSNGPLADRGRDYVLASGSEKAAAWVTASFVAAIVVTLLVLALKGTTEVDNAAVGIVVALFGVLITGVFVFATFRIDRGAKLQAYQTAREVATSVARELGAKAAEDAKHEASKAARKVAAVAIESQEGNSRSGTGYSKKGSSGI